MYLIEMFFILLCIDIKNAGVFRTSIFLDTLLTDLGSTILTLFSTFYLILVLFTLFYFFVLFSVQLGIRKYSSTPMNCQVQFQ